MLEVGRRIGLDLYEYVSSFATSVSVPGSTAMIQMPSTVLERCALRHKPMPHIRADQSEVMLRPI